MTIAVSDISFLIPSNVIMLSEICDDFCCHKGSKGTKGSKGFSNELMTLAFIGTFEKPEYP